MNEAQKREIYAALCRKALLNAQRIGGELRDFPGCENGDYFAGDRSAMRRVTHVYSWLPSFFTGMALLAAEETGDFQAVRWCAERYGEYCSKVFSTPRDTMHDLGFLYSLYSTLDWRLTGSDDMRRLSLRAAEVLAHRFVPQGRYLRAWGRMDDTLPDGLDPRLAGDNFFAHSRGLVIIDTMMNLPLLFWAGRETDDPFFTSVACAHADTTLSTLVRPDGSVCHAYRFDEQGRPAEEFNDCGYGVGSHWARGTAWAVYGYVLAYRYTGFERYRAAALRLAGVYLKNCGENCIPVWDFRLPADRPATPSDTRGPARWDVTDPANCSRNRDASAAAIMACAFLELDGLEPHPELRAYAGAVQAAFAGGLLNLDEKVPGMLRSVGGNDIYACYGDYFAMELFARGLGKTVLPW